MAGGFSVTISAVDQVTATIDRINARMDKFTGGFTKQYRTANASVERMQASFARFGNAVGLNRVTQGVRGLGRAAIYTADKLSEVVPLVGVIGAAASVAGIQRMTSAWAEWGLKISNSSRQMGVGARQLTGWEGAATLAVINALGKPALVIIMDGVPPTGPAAWPGLLELLEWAACTFPAGQTMPRAAYDVLVEDVIAHRRFVWVDTSPEMLPAWTRALGRRPEGLGVCSANHASANEDAHCP